MSQKNGLISSSTVHLALVTSRIIKIMFTPITIPQSASRCWIMSNQNSKKHGLGEKNNGTNYSNLGKYLILNVWKIRRLRYCISHNFSPSNQEKV
jgi:hypothetical protein